jgi:hypothetical protein
MAITLARSLAHWMLHRKARHVFGPYTIRAHGYVITHTGHGTGPQRARRRLLPGTRPGRPVPGLAKSRCCGPCQDRPLPLMRNAMSFAAWWKMVIVQASGDVSPGRLAQ